MAFQKFSTFHQHTVGGLWKIEEPLSFFTQQVGLTLPTSNEWRVITHTRRKTEWLAARMALQQTMNCWGYEYHGLEKDTIGKPSLIRHPSLSVSIAHSYPYVWVVVSKRPEIGCDIQKPTQKLDVIQQRFLSPEELEEAAGDRWKLCIYWAAKEALYKAEGSINMDFREDLFIHPFVKQEVGTVQGTVKGQEQYTVYFEVCPDYVLCWGMKSTS